MDLQSFLWKDVLNGDTKAFRQLVDTYFPMLYNYGLGFSKNEELIKDTVQEVFVVIWQRKEYLSRDVNVKAYLFSSFRRALHRKIKPLMRVVSLNDYNHERNSFEIGAYLEDEIITKESSATLAKHVVSLLNMLPARQKEVIYLKYFMSLSRDEISQSLDIAPQTVSNIIQMALKKLRSVSPGEIRISM